MKESFFRFVIRYGIKFLSLLARFGQGAAFVAQAMGRSVKGILGHLLPVLVFIYLGVRKVRLKISKWLAPLRGHLWYIFAHRYFVHGLVVVIVIIGSIPSLRAADAAAGNFGDQMPLNALITSDDGDMGSIVDDTIPTEEFNSYVEALFQDQPPEKTEIGSALTLDGGALLNQDLPGTTQTLTRSEIVQYTVESGDTLGSIAEKFGVTVTTILWENKLRLTSILQLGQKLVILPTSGVSHLVKRGETLEKIAKQYGATLDDIEQYNKVELARIAPGIKLIIPGGRPYAEPQPVIVVKRREVPIVSKVIPPASTGVAIGRLLWPTVSRRITQYFKWSHAAIDIGEPIGTPIYAVEDGVAEIAGWGRGGWGNTVLIDHGSGLKTRYAHAVKVLVGVGDTVSKGQVIALSGNTGHSTGPHLHFGVYMNGRAVNPLQYVR